MRERTIRLQNRLALTYILFTTAAVGILTLAINVVTGITFNTLIMENINSKSEEILRTMGDLYRPMPGKFDGAGVEAMGMHFVHEGYILTLEDRRGEPVWDARSCDMRQCAEVINDISSRMEGNFRLNGGMRKQRYPVYYGGVTVGTVSIETYGPFFYSETETRFLSSINRLLLISGVGLSLLGALVSLALSRSIAKPVLKAAEAARRIAGAHADGVNPEGLIIRIDDHYRTWELRDLSRSLNELAVELEAGEGRQKQLTADVAHELRTPLTCLQGNIEAMIDGVYKPDREHLVSCHEEIIRLVNLVKDLNTLTSLEGDAGDLAGGSRRDDSSGGIKKLNKTRFDLARLIQTTAEQFRPAAREKGIALNLRLQESPINADYDRLKQVFVNLLSNAVEYTDSGGVTVGIEGTAGNWEVVVDDTGIGIPEEDLPHIFERFYRTDKSRSRSTGGAGIGLTIAAAIVSAHGGRISVESKAGGPGCAGSVFRVRLQDRN